MAQQAGYQRTDNQSPLQIRNGQSQENYSFHVFIAPNKSFGYDILRNDKIIFHQPAFSKSIIYNGEMLIRKEQANAAAMLAIEKIKKGINPELSGDELRKITALL